MSGFVSFVAISNGAIQLEIMQARQQETPPNLPLILGDEHGAETKPRFCAE
jgi:hypothetical protein